MDKYYGQKWRIDQDKSADIDANCKLQFNVDINGLY